MPNYCGNKTSTLCIRNISPLASTAFYECGVFACLVFQYFCPGTGLLRAESAFLVLKQITESFETRSKTTKHKAQVCTRFVFAVCSPSWSTAQLNFQQKHPPALHAQHHIKIISILSVEATHHSCILISAIQNSQAHHPSKRGKLNNTGLLPH